MYYDMYVQNKYGTELFRQTAHRLGDYGITSDKHSAIWGST